MGGIKMGTITILPETPKDPLALIGRRAGICWNADIINEEKNIGIYYGFNVAWSFSKFGICEKIS